MNSVSFRYSDFIKPSMRYYFYNTLRFRLMYLIGLVTLAFGCSVLSVSYSEILLLMSLFLLFLLTYVYLNYCYFAPMRVARDRRYHKIYTLSFSEEGVELKADDFKSQLNWQYIKKVWETKDLYYLFHDKRAFWILPKNKFISQEQEELFREIVSRNHRIQKGINR
ncbi:YcxB family protein [Paenibacillus durus]|uniref:YcxB-like C-terminal domain-containing protein n=1 Tax=Paenibacillus durus TaxID=44251 RepID=A0A089HW95_PAEDU|nr:hypothetical protein PDUR_26430 [Paenibacillus durus]